MNIHIRLETPADYRAVEELTREAFWINTDSNPFIDEQAIDIIRTTMREHGRIWGRIKQGSGRIK